MTKQSIDDLPWCNSAPPPPPPPPQRKRGGGDRILGPIYFSFLKPRANGRNIVGQQLPILLDVTCCVLLRTLLHVVACYWELLRKV